MNRSFFYQLVLTLLLLPLWSGVQAVQVKDIYSANIATVSQDKKERFEAFTQALNSVLVKVTGNSTITAEPGLKELIEKSRYYVQQFKYVSFKNAQKSKLNILEPAVEEGAQPTYKFVLKVRFARTAIDSFLKKLKIPIWGTDRPETLVWLLAESSMETNASDQEFNQLLQAQLSTHASQYGVPVFFPVMDLKDQRFAETLAVDIDNSENLLAASQRYATRNILLGRLKQKPLEEENSESAQSTPADVTIAQSDENFAEESAVLWYLDWRFIYDNRISRWHSENTDLGLAIREGIDGVGILLSATHAIGGINTSKNTIQLNVSNIHNLADYSRVMEYLKKLQTTTSVLLNKLQGDNFLFQLEIHGELHRFEEKLLIDSYLVPDANYLNQAGESGVTQVPLAYRLQ